MPGEASQFALFAPLSRRHYNALSFPGIRLNTVTGVMMIQLRRIHAVVAASLLAIVSTGCGSAASSTDRSTQQTGSDSAAGGDHFENAAASIVAGAKESVAAASSDEEAINRAHMSLEALRMIGMLGEFDTEVQAEKLLDDLQASARPSLAEAVIQLRLARHLRQWSQLDKSARNKAVERYVADVKQSGLTPGHAELMIQISDMLEGAGDSQLAAKAINELLPAFRASNDASVRRMATLLEGTARRLPGNKLELEGTLLDGSKLDWESYRGKVVLVDYFASWCGPCRAEVPNILANHAAYRDKGFEVLGINMDERQANVESYMQQTGFQFPTLFSDDPNATGGNHPMGRKYGITTLPRAILVDKNGIIVSAEARGRELGEQLQRLLGPPGNSQESATSTDDTAVPEAPAES